MKTVSLLYEAELFVWTNAVTVQESSCLLAFPMARATDVHAREKRI